MSEDEALKLIKIEAEDKKATLSKNETEELILRTGGVPLAIVWSIGLISVGNDPQTVVRKLRNGQSDIARFCFDESIKQIRNSESYDLLAALAVSDSDVNRETVGIVAGLENDKIGRDEGLAKLIQLSLINHDHTTFSILPLTRVYMIEELEKNEELRTTLKERWSKYFQVPIWNLPHPRNPNFTGRNDILVELEKNLERGDISALTQAISGLGGVGKTQLAVEYAYRHSSKFKFVWWLQAETEVSLINSLTQLATELELPESSQSEQNITIAALLRWLENNEGWLLIYDNVNDPNQIQNLSPRKGGQIIITSRFTNWRGVAQTLSVNIWSEIEAVEFLLKRTGQNDKEEAGKLAEELGYLPLALEHAGAYLAENALLNFADYNQLFQKKN